MLTINITGPESSGKGHLMAYIFNDLKNKGINVQLQSEETHNAPKVAKSNEELIERLKTVDVRITELQTAI